MPIMHIANKHQTTNKHPAQAAPTAVIVGVNNVFCASRSRLASERVAVQDLGSGWDANVFNLKEESYRHVHGLFTTLQCMDGVAHFHTFLFSYFSVPPLRSPTSRPYLLGFSVYSVVKVDKA